MYSRTQDGRQLTLRWRDVEGGQRAPALLRLEAASAAQAHDILLAMRRQDRSAWVRGPWSTVMHGERVDPHFENEELERATQHEAPAIVLTHLMVRIVGHEEEYECTVDADAR